MSPRFYTIEIAMILIVNIDQHLRGKDHYRINEEKQKMWQLWVIWQA